MLLTAIWLRRYEGVFHEKALINLDNDLSTLKVEMRDYFDVGTQSWRYKSLDASMMSTDETGTKEYFAVHIPTQPDHDVTMEVRSLTPSEGMVDKRYLIFTTTNYLNPQEVEITGQDDNVLDGDVRFGISLNTSSMDPEFDDVTWRFYLVCFMKS